MDGRSGSQRRRSVAGAVIATLLAVGVQAAPRDPGPSANREHTAKADTASQPSTSDHSPIPAVYGQIPAWSAALEQHGQERVRYADDLASRGAIHTAQHELFKVLGTVAQTLDTDQGTSQHSDALASARVALEEARDFMRAAPQGGRPQSAAVIAASHRTPLLHQTDAGQVNPIVATQLYYSHAGRQFAAAAGGQPIAAEALFALGRVVSIMRDHPLERDAASVPMFDQKMLVFYQAAWAVDPRHHRAANEYGVLLARFNQWPQACQAFEYSVAQCPEAQNTRNLAIAYERLGERELAQQARQLGQSLNSGTPHTGVNSAGSASGGIAPAVEWVDLDTFAQSGSPAGWSSFAARDSSSDLGGPNARRPGSTSKPAPATAALQQLPPDKSRGLISNRHLDRWRSVFRSDRFESRRPE